MEKDRVGFVWRWLRISFWAMIILWAFLLLPLLSNESLVYILLSYILAILIIFTFVVSIIHLVKYNKKTFAIIALVISSIGLLILLIGFIIGIISVLASVG